MIGIVFVRIKRNKERLLKRRAIPPQKLIDSEPFQLSIAQSLLILQVEQGLQKSGLKYNIQKGLQ